MKFFSQRLIIVFFGIAVFLVANCAAQTSSIFTDEKTAREHLASGNMQKAIKHYNELLRVDANNKNYNAFIGYAYLNSNFSKAKAVEHFEKAIKHAVVDPYIYYDLGKAYMLTYQFDNAIESFNKFIKKGIKEEGNDLPATRYKEMCENAKMLISLRSNVTVQNVGEGINTKFPDYNPFINEDESMLFFTTKRDKNSPAVEDVDGYKTADVYFSEFDGRKWSKPKRLPNTINSAYIEEIVGLSADGSSLITYVDNEVGLDDLFISTKKKKSYQKSENLGGAINSEYVENGGMISPDGNWFFFSSNRPDGFGGFDIYYSRRLPNEDWSYPVNAGNAINTEFDDSYPYLAPDGKTFFFASKGHNSMGGYDIFKTTWDEASLSFSAPENLGFPVNTPDDNKTISISKSGRYAYIGDFRENGLGDLDIYKITFLDVPAPLYIIDVHLLTADSTQITPATIAPNTDYKIVIRNAGTKKTVGTFRPNLHNAQFSIVLPSGYYLIDFYINNVENQSFEYYIDDREPLRNNLQLQLIVP